MVDETNLTPPSNLARLADSASDIARMSEHSLLPENVLSERHLIYAGSEQYNIVNQYRNIRTRLLERCRGGNAITLVSAVGESSAATTTTVNLAISFALDSTKTALLVDCALHGPSLADLLGVPAGRGLTDYLVSPEIGVERILYQTGVPRLRLIPAGQFIESGAEFFTSSLMSGFLAAIKQRYPDRHIILHSPPILRSADARILSALCDMTVLTIDYASSTPAKVLEAANIVGREKLAGVILQQVPTLSTRQR